MKPRHISISLEKSIAIWAERNGRPLVEAYAIRKAILSEILNFQIEYGIHVITVFLLRAGGLKGDEMEASLDSISGLFDELAMSELIAEKGVRISVMGRWYDLPNRQVEAIRRAMDATAKNERYFLNFCVQYDGAEELADSCRVICRKVKADKLDPEAITPELMRENSYFSSFLPPDIAIITGDKRLGGLMIGDVADTVLYFTNRPWIELNVFDVKKAVDLFELVGNKIRE